MGVLDIESRTLKLNERLSKLKENTKSNVQSLLFSKEKFNENSAKKWATEKGYSAQKVDVTDSFIHLTQHPSSKFNSFKTVIMAPGVQARMAGNFVSKFVGHVYLNPISKFSELKSDLDLPMPLIGEGRFLCEGQSRDGYISRSDLESSLDRWEDVPIIDWHDMTNMNAPTQHKISDRKGYLKKPRVEFVDGKFWVIAPVEIIDRSFGYHLYLRLMEGKPLEVSPEFASIPYWINGNKFLGNINPQLVSIVDKGHIKGNSLTFPS